MSVLKPMPEEEKEIEAEMLYDLWKEVHRRGALASDEEIAWLRENGMHGGMADLESPWHDPTTSATSQEPRLERTWSIAFTGSRKWKRGTVPESTTVVTGFERSHRKREGASGVLPSTVASKA
jgi:hypothetical protein